MSLDVSPEEHETIPTKRGHRRGRRKALGAGCLVCLLLACGSAGLLGVLVRSGPVQVGLPGGNLLKLGSDSFVLSNYSFQNGTTYFADLNGNGVRNIVELHVLPDSHRFEIVLHSAAKGSQQEQNVLGGPMP